MANDNTLYFGYGSNLDYNDWINWCKKKGHDPDGMDEVGIAYLHGYEMKFHYYSNGREGGAADVVKGGTDSITPGVLFNLNPNALKVMDKKEGHPDYYKRTQVTVRTSNGEEISALTYTVVQDKIRDYFVKPTDEYVSIIRNGLERRGLSTKMLEFALGAEKGI